MLHSVLAAARRLVSGLAVVAAVSCLLFYAGDVLGDPIVALLPPDASEAEKELLRSSLGLDRPLWLRFASYLGALLHGHFGQSYKLGDPVEHIVGPYLWGTVKLIGLALPLGLIGGAVLGLAAHLLPRKWDGAFNRMLLVLHALPGFVPCILAIELFSVRLKWLPPSGSHGWVSLVMPVCLLAGAEAIKTGIVLRTKLAETAKEKFVVTARAKGIGPPRFLFHYLLRPAAAMMFSFVSIQLGVLLSSTVVVEAVFAYPGIGNLAVQALANRDMPLIQACVVCTTLLFLGARFVLDVAYPAIDPRVKQTWV